MTRGRKILAGLVAIVALAYGAFVYLNPTVTFNYRLTIEAMTPDGPKTGSGVIQVSYTSQCCVPGFGTRGQTSLTGEAVYLDLGRGKNLFVTLTEQGFGRSESKSEPLGGETALIWLPIQVFKFNWNWGDERELARQVLRARGSGPQDVPLIALPPTVTFRDLSDPKSVELVDPRTIEVNFGEGYTLTKVTLELTDALPTPGIGKLLQWLPYYYGKQLDEQRFHTADATLKIANSLSSGAFSTFKEGQ
jgi:hypothetical protein